MTTGIVMLLTPAATGAAPGNLVYSVPTVAVPPPHSRGWYWTWVQGDLHVVGTRLLTDRTTPRDKGYAPLMPPPWPRRHGHRGND